MKRTERTEKRALSQALSVHRWLHFVSELMPLQLLQLAPCLACAGRPETYALPGDLVYLEHPWERPQQLLCSTCSKLPVWPVLEDLKPTHCLVI